MSANPITYSETSEFKKQFKKLLKKNWTGFEEDFQRFKATHVGLFHSIGSIGGVHGIERLQGFGNTCKPEIEIYKARKFRVQMLRRGAKSGIRVVYAFHPQDMEVAFLEIYHKNDRKNNNPQLAHNYLKAVCP